ncbi:MAG: hypothetical protein B5M55_00005, partial [Desulfococcus sp. 4484_242]
RRAAASPTDKSQRDGALPAVASEKPFCPHLLSYYGSFLLLKRKALSNKGVGGRRPKEIFFKEIVIHRAWGSPSEHGWDWKGLYVMPDRLQ